MRGGGIGMCIAHPSSRKRTRIDALGVRCEGVGV